MARIRSTHPGAPKDEDVATMSIWARHVWVYLPCYADCDGRLLDQPFRLRLEILPLDDVNMDNVLGELAAKRHIIRYTGADGRKYLQIRTFHRWQKPHKNEESRGYPAPNESDTVGQTREEVGVLGKNSEDDVSKDELPLLSSGSGQSVSLAPEKVSPPARDPNTTDPVLWGAGVWHRKYSAIWTERYHLTPGGGAATAKACGDLDGMLSALPVAERMDAQCQALAMLTAYLGDPTAATAKHPFRWFVDRFDALRAKPQPGMAVARGSPRPLEKTFLERRNDAAILESMKPRAT